jgi:PAS domain S-box-containing protein
MASRATVLSGDQYRLLVERSPVMFWRSGLDAKCDYLNDTWLQFTGRTLEMELGEGWTDGVHPEDVGGCVQHFRDHFTARRAFEMVYRLRRHDGVYRYVFDRGVPFEDGQGRFAGFIGSCVDVHEHEVGKREKTNFLMMMAHEQRTPLSALKMFVASMAFRAKHGEPLTDEMFWRLNSQIDRFARLVDMLSETARLEDGRVLELVREPLDLRELVERVMRFRAESIASRSDHGQARHEIKLLGDARPCHVFGDALRLEQVFINLLDNAVKYSPKGGSVHVSITPVDTRYEVAVTDCGIGIPSEDLPALTQRYFRARNVSSEHFPGLGIGLSLCKEILEQHGGSMTVTTALQKGTTVRVFVPNFRCATR